MVTETFEWYCTLKFVMAKTAWSNNTQYQLKGNFKLLLMSLEIHKQHAHPNAQSLLGAQLSLSDGIMLSL